ncbi:MAG: FdtA/QdtA family cupin domain-containing protein [Lachnospiraceae bacterium]
MQIKKYSFPQHGDFRGNLVAIEEIKDIPFEIKRVYYMYDTLNHVIRGKHAHKELEQILICIHGSCKILLDDGTEKEEVVLDKPFEGLYLSGNIWREMYGFSEGAVLMVLASALYNENDYIRDYEEFKNTKLGRLT